MNDKDLVVKPEVEKGIKALTKYAQEVDVVTYTDACEAGERISQIFNLKKAVEDQRTEITKPLNASLRSINAFFKKFSEPLEIIDNQLRNKILEYSKSTEERVYGVIHLRKNTIAEVVDESKVPKQFFSVDMVKVKRALENDEVIPGIQVRKEDNVSL